MNDKHAKKQQDTPKKPEPFVLVVFGASGDLTRRKLLPAFFHLHCRDLLPEGSAIVGYGRTEKTDESFREELWEPVSDELSCEGESVDRRQWERFARRIYYRVGDYDKAEDFAELQRRIEGICKDHGIRPNCLFYLAVPPGSVEAIIGQLEQSQLFQKGARREPWSRIVVEKPFGHDLQSARGLNERLREAFDENQIFRIDHYLGKETVQNILVLRFANGIFEPLWNNKHIDHVQITVAEDGGVGRRGPYYDNAGAIRDIVQNHMMHLLSLVAMEPPTSLAADDVRDEKVQVLRCLRHLSAGCAAGMVVRGQYGEGEVAGRSVNAYRQEHGVDENSQTETFAAMQVNVDNWRWAGVPFYLRTGKRLAEKRTEISIHFRQVPRVLFNLPPDGPLPPNVLVLRIQPDEGISMQFQAKSPGPAVDIRTTELDFSYAEAFGATPPDAYQRLLLDAAAGDATLFARADEVEAAWDFITPIVKGCRTKDAKQLAFYPAGSWGPRAADALMLADNRQWRLR